MKRRCSGLHRGRWLYQKRLEHGLVDRGRFRLGAVNTMHAPLGHGGPEGAAAGVRSEHKSQQLGGDRLEGHSAPTLASVSAREAGELRTMV